MAFELLRTGRYPITRYSKERNSDIKLRFYRNKKGMDNIGQIALNIAWFDSVNESRYARIYIDKSRLLIKIQPKRRPVVDARKVRYKNGEVFIGGGKLLRDAGFPFGTYKMVKDSVFRFEADDIGETYE